MRTVRKPNSMFFKRSFLWTGFFLFFFSLSMCHVNVATLNLNGARDMHKRAELAEFIRKKLMLLCYKRHILILVMLLIGQ